MTPHDIREFLRAALSEDIGYGDITTSSIIPEDKSSKATLLAKEDFILAGLPFFKEVFLLLDEDIRFKGFYNDGEGISKGSTIAFIEGKARTLLMGERTGLNLIQRLSGIATLTNRFVEKIKGLPVKITDTRKTTPMLRFFEKYAVRIGGGYNHRYGLYDGILIKDNHIKIAGGIKRAVKKARQEAHHLLRIEVEVRDIKELRDALDAGADVIMLDNMSIDMMKEAVRIVNGKAMLEASGNISLENITDVAKTGIDVISIGALTHSARAVDMSMKL